MGVKRGDLKVAVIEARSLPNKSRVKGRQDVFVELKIEGVAYRTRTVKDAGSAARFDEELTVNIVDSRRVLEITVFKPGHLGGDAVPIGDFTMDFGEVIAGNKEASSYNGWVDLNEKKPSSQEKGQLRLEFTYVPFRRQTLQTPAVPGKDRPLQPLPIPPPKQGAFHPPPAGYPPVPSPPREQPSTLPGTFPLDATPGASVNNMPMPQVALAPTPGGAGLTSTGFSGPFYAPPDPWSQMPSSGGPSESSPSPRPFPPPPGKLSPQFSRYPTGVPASANTAFLQTGYPFAASPYTPDPLSEGVGFGRPAASPGGPHPALGTGPYAFVPPQVNPYPTPPGPGGFVVPPAGFAVPTQHVSTSPPLLHPQHNSAYPAPPLPPRRK